MRKIGRREGGLLVLYFSGGAYRAGTVLFMAVQRFFSRVCLMRAEVLFERYFLLIPSCW